MSTAPKKAPKAPTPSDIKKAAKKPAVKTPAKPATKTPVTKVAKPAVKATLAPTKKVERKVEKTPTVVTTSPQPAPVHAKSSLLSSVLTKHISGVRNAQK